MFSEYRQEFTPQRAAEFKTPANYLDRTFDYEMNWWKNHVKLFLQHYHKHDVHLIFYEHLLADFDTELNALLAYLGIALDAAARERITKAVAFETMKANSPGHLRKGQAYKWMEQMSAEQQEATLKLVGQELRILGYPELPGDNPPLPSYDAITAEAVAALKPKKKPLHERALRKLLRVLD
jgi:aryl sulfotransferase